METNPRVVYEKATGEKINPNSFSSIAKYCGWLEGELAHEYMDNMIANEPPKLCKYCHSDHWRPDSEFCSGACEDNYNKYGVEEGEELEPMKDSLHPEGL